MFVGGGGGGTVFAIAVTTGSCALKLEKLPDYSYWARFCSLSAGHLRQTFMLTTQMPFITLLIIVISVFAIEITYRYQRITNAVLNMKVTVYAMCSPMFLFILEFTFLDISNDWIEDTTVPNLPYAPICPLL